MGPVPDQGLPTLLIRYYWGLTLNMRHRRAISESLYQVEVIWGGTSHRFLGVEAVARTAR